MQNTKLYAAFLVLVILAGIFSLSPAISPLTSSVVLRGNRGEFLIRGYARSGSARDIQEAVDWVAGDGGIGNVYIPEGTFNFVEVGETWKTVNVPAGVNLFGAPTEKDGDGQVIQWNTVLVMPSEVPGSDAVGIPAWFKINGAGDPTKPSRFSDIKLVGYRSINSSSTSMHKAIAVTGVVDFRIDHNYFLDCTAGISVLAASKNGAIRGVIDHNRLVNTVGDPGYALYADRTLDYGVMPARTWDSDYWDSNITNVVGHYTDYSIYIEDNYFSRWRHNFCSNNGMHTVFRHNIVVDDNGICLDAHGTYTKVGTRAMEIYDNQFLDPNYEYELQPNVVNWRGGGGVFFNNTMRDWYFTVYWRDEGSQWPQGYPGSTDCPVCFWSNTYLTGGTHYDQPVQFESGSHVGSNVYIDQGAMPNYTPYTYPHPLTLT